MFTAAELVQEARRELKLRQHVYPNRIHTGRLSQRQADKQIAMMRAIIEVLEREDAKEQLI